MRRGYLPQMIFSTSGQLVAIATGADACTEHEWGAEPLLEALADYSGQDADLVAALRKGDSVAFPSVFEKARIVRPEALQLRVRTDKDGHPEALLGLAEHQTVWDEPELTYVPRDLATPQAIAAAWDSQRFAFRVKGTQYVNALKEFYEALLRGDVHFGGRFYEAPCGVQTRGVVLVNAQLLDDASKERVLKAQTEYENQLRLQARNDINELREEMAEASGSKAVHIGHLWMVWSPTTDSGVAYALNPGHGVKAQYWGPYTREQLLDWARARYSYPLLPLDVSASRRDEPNAGQPKATKL